MPTYLLRNRKAQLLTLCLPLTLAAGGCKLLSKIGIGSGPAAPMTPATQPASPYPHGGVAANNTNKAFIAKASSGTLGTIEQLDPRLEAIIAPGTSVEKIVEGLDWAEGPIWDKVANRLYFSDVPQNVVYAWDAKTGVREYVRPSGYTGTTPRGGEPGSNGLTIDATGRLVLCQHGDRAVSRLEGFTPADKENSNKPVITPIVNQYQGKKLNSPNDLIFDSKKNLLFTDPPYGLPAKDETDPTKEIPFQGVYRLSNKGKLTLLTQAMSRPNGLALSPDEKTLYVANSDPKKAVWMAFPVKEDGSVGEGKVFYDSTPNVGAENKGLPDGLKVDTNGNLFATGPGGVLIFAPDGKLLGVIRTGEATANVAWGDDGSTLYICADSYVAKVKTLTKGW